MVGREQLPPWTHHTPRRCNGRSSEFSAKIPSGACRRSWLVNKFGCEMEQKRRFFVRRRPPRFAVDALPEHFELFVQQNDCFGTPATRTRDVMLVEDIIDRHASSHTRFVGYGRGPR